MRNLCWIFAATMLGLAAGRLAAVSAAEEGKADANALRLAKRQLHSQNVFERLSAIERLQEGPPLAAAKMVVPAVLNDSSADVRRAAADALLTWKDDREVCVFLLKSLKQEFLGKKNNPQVGAPLLMALAASELPETRDDLNKFSASREGLLAVAMVADELGKRGDERALTSLKRMSELKCFSSTYACRRAIVGAMISIRTRPSLDALLTLLPHLDGEVRGDVLRHLTAVSSQHFSTDIKAWQAWWKEQKESFQFPAKGPDIRSVQDAPPGTSAYYGMTIYARRMVFVLDISGSMDRRLPAAERELLTAIDGLPDEASFNIVIFSNKAMVWQRNLMPATPASKGAARHFVSSLRAGGHTAAYDALEEAFRFDTEAVYFLSDGEPNAGKIPAADGILAAIQQANLTRRVSVYTIGIAPGLPGGRFDAFLAALAEQNYGAYRRVEQ